MLPSYCITLGESTERWRAFQKHAQGLGIQRFKAIDCRGAAYRAWQPLIGRAEFRELELIAVRGERERHDQLTPGAVGCYLSHLEVMRRAYAHGHAKVVIFEDDAQPPPDLPDRLVQQLAALDALDPAWDMLILGYIAPGKSMMPVPVRLHRFYRLHAYVVSERGMAKCLALCYPLRKQLDSALSELSERIHIYGSVP